MGFVATPAQVQAFQRLSSGDVRFTQEGISVEFQTTPEFVRSVLPPCFEPGSTPTCSANVSLWQSELCGDFEAAVITVLARYGKIEGYYTLLMLVSGDTPVTWGREVWGEAKKTGSARLFRDGSRRFGYGERNGTRIIEIDGEFGAEAPPSVAPLTLLEVKAFPKHDGMGLEYEPIVLVLDATRKHQATAEGTASLTLRGTPFDPLDTIPVVSVGKARYSSGECCDRVVLAERQANAAGYLPFVLGRNYDPLEVFPVARRYQR